MHDGTWYGIPCSVWPGGVSPPGCALSWSPVKINSVLAEPRTEHKTGFLVPTCTRNKEEPELTPALSPWTRSNASLDPKISPGAWESSEQARGSGAPGQDDQQEILQPGLFRLLCSSCQMGEPASPQNSMQGEIAKLEQLISWLFSYR